MKAPNSKLQRRNIKICVVYTLNNKYILYLVDFSFEQGIPNSNTSFHCSKLSTEPHYFITWKKTQKLNFYLTFEFLNCKPRPQTFVITLNQSGQNRTLKLLSQTAYCQYESKSETPLSELYIFNHELTFLHSKNTEPSTSCLNIFTPHFPMKIWTVKLKPVTPNFPPFASVCEPKIQMSFDIIISITKV